mgnify:FL=1
MKELRLDPGVDTFSRWMAHYVAEQIILAETLEGVEKTKAESRCFETILKLWQHRNSLPSGHRPFEDFGPIFNALSRLDPDNPQPYYYSYADDLVSDVSNVESNENEAQHWVEIAKGFDKGTRVLLEFIFHEAASYALDEKNLEWLQNTICIPPSEDISIIVKLVNEYEDDPKELSTDKSNSNKEKIKSRINQLDGYIAYSQELRSYLSNLVNNSEEVSTSTGDDPD